MSSPSGSSSRWDRLAIRSGASVALVFAVPFSVAARIFSDNSGLTVFLALCAALGFLLGSAIAAWHQQRGTPLTHAMVTASATYIGAQSIFIVVKLLRGAEVHWIAAFFNFTITLAVSVLGGFLGSVMQQRGILPQGRRKL
ncbi:MAG: hypothetical protein WCG40_08015 [Actinomycetes bacterium]